jgi:N-methylhydantoinase B/oxoprolinase/acetone carboxylase alpha subunit
VSNAPHIPVHLGSMQEAVQYQVMDRTEQCGNLHVILLAFSIWIYNLSYH